MLYAPPKPEIPSFPATLIIALALIECVCAAMGIMFALRG